MNKDGKGVAFANLAQRAIDQEGQPHTRQKIADHLNISYDTLANRLTGRSRFSADEIRNLVSLLPDLMLFDYFLEETDYFVAKRKNHNISPAQSIEDGAIETSTEASHVLEQVHIALEDLKFCHQDRALIIKEIQDVERALASLTKTIEENGPGRRNKNLIDNAG